MPNAATAPLNPGEAVASRTITAYTLTPEQLRKSQALHRANLTLSLGSGLFGFAVLVALVVLRIGPWLQRLAERSSKKRMVQAAIVVIVLQSILAAFRLPFELYGHHVGRQYGLSVQGWLSWLADWAKSQLLAAILAIFVVWGLYALIRRAPRRWWFYAWLCSLPVAAALVFAAPVLIDPLFERFEPLAQTNPQLAAELRNLAHSAGLEIPSSRIFLMHAGDKVTTYNAYVTGLGATKRIVVWDTTARDLTGPQILFVFGHEMGHYVLHHIYLGLAFTALLLAAGLCLGQWMAESALRRFGPRWQLSALGDWSSLPLLLLLASLLSFFAEPPANAFSRWEEHAADAYGLAITRPITPGAGQAAAQAFQLLGERSYSYPNPSPLLVFWSYSHPPIAQRIWFVLSADSEP
jgi:Zn-dependent protease with chaperone function